MKKNYKIRISSEIGTVANNYIDQDSVIKIMSMLLDQENKNIAKDEIQKLKEPCLDNDTKRNNSWSREENLFIIDNIDKSGPKLCKSPILAGKSYASVNSRASAIRTGAYRRLGQIDVILSILREKGKYALAEKLEKNYEKGTGKTLNSRIEVKSNDEETKIDIS